MCRCSLIGRLAGDVYYPEGLFKVARFTVVTNRGLPNGGERADFHPCVLIGHKHMPRLENVKRGSLVYVSGPIERNKVNRDGQEVDEAVVMVKEIIPLGESTH